jgi:hypothetical protein
MRKLKWSREQKQWVLNNFKRVNDLRQKIPEGRAISLSIRNERVTDDKFDQCFVCLKAELPPPESGQHIIRLRSFSGAFEPQNIGRLCAGCASGGAPKYLKLRNRIEIAFLNTEILAINGEWL